MGYGPSMPRVAPGYELELNNTKWAVAHHASLTGFSPCCGCFSIFPDPNVTTRLRFGLGRTDKPVAPGATPPIDAVTGCGPPSFGDATQVRLGLETIPCGGVDMGSDTVTDFSLAVNDAVAAAVAHGFSGYFLDDEAEMQHLPCPAPAAPGTCTVLRYSWFIGNLSAALTKAGKRLAVAVGDWGGGMIDGPPNIAIYAKAAPAATMYDMSTYFPSMATGPAITRVQSMIQQGVPVQQVALGLGMPPLAGHANASCSNCGAACGPKPWHGGNSQDPNGKCCGCWDYNWNQTEMRAFLQAASAANISEIYVPRPLSVPPGTTNGAPQWFLDELALYLSSDLPPQPPFKTDDAPTRTVMAWIAGDTNKSKDFILRGAGKGAVNAVSCGGLWNLAANKTDAWLTISQPAIDAHRTTWQEGDAKAAGIRTFPSMNLNWDIISFRTLVQPRVQHKFIADLVAQVEASDVDGLSIDFEPQNPKHANGSLAPESPKAPTIQDGLAFAAFLDALAKAMHKLPGRRRVLSMAGSMAGSSVAGACWSVGPLDGGKRNHTWDLLPCPWIDNIWQLGALAASSLDVMIAMDGYTSNSSIFPYVTWIYQKYFPIGRIGWAAISHRTGPLRKAKDHLVLPLTRSSLCEHFSPLHRLRRNRGRTHCLLPCCVFPTLLTLTTSESLNLPQAHGCLRGLRE
eukprot:SAG22_NODE_479_length_9968_cov_43.841524_1_plen_683_part_00